MTNIQILFVEDDLEFSWLVVAYFKKRLKTPVRVIQSYLDATTLLAKENFDFIVCGLEAPGVASSLLRFIEQHSPNSKFILFTADDAFERGALVGPRFLGHVPKTKISDLVDVISKAE